LHCLREASYDRHTMVCFKLMYRNHICALGLMVIVQR